MAYVAIYKDEDFRVKVEEPEPGHYSVQINDEVYEIDFFKAHENIYSLIIDHQSYEVDVDELDNGAYSVMLKDDHFDVQVVDERKKKLAEKLGAGESGQQEVKSPMAGSIWKLLKNKGAEVKEGEVLIILEAMKMENEIRSPIDGVVTSVDVEEGSTVSAGTRLCLVAPTKM